MVGAIDAIHDGAIDTSTTITGDEYFMGGHFPGAPVIPGAMVQEMTTQTVWILLAARFNPMQEFNTHDPFFNEYALGVLVRVKGAPFRGFARPIDTLNTQVELADQLGDIFEFRGRISLHGKVIMSNSFQLANVLSATFRGYTNTTSATLFRPV
ncbi:MAG: hypothetical protein P8J37_10605 [Fuerstiella sp.]|nr:hypothetical protein [Fuerstiella sp.]